MTSTSKQMITRTALLCLLASVQAEIGGTVWKESKYQYTPTSTNKIGVNNGVPYSNDDDVKTRMKAAMPLDGDMNSTYENKDNVKRIKEVMTESKFDDFFPDKHSIYTYDGFLEAAAKFEQFCGEDHAWGSNNDAGHKKACKKELSALFAHFTQESNSLKVIKEYGCPDTHGHCDYTGQSAWAGASYPPQDGEQYFGRGPFQLSYPYNIGEFSEMLGDSTYGGKMTLLEDPSEIEDDKVNVFLAAFWFYMTPQSPKPSMHDIVTENFKPNAYDTSSGRFSHGFAGTINIINGGLECDLCSDSTRIQKDKNQLEAGELSYYTWAELRDDGAMHDLFGLFDWYKKIDSGSRSTFYKLRAAQNKQDHDAEWDDQTELTKASCEILGDRTFTEDARANNRASYYKNFMGEFGLTIDDDEELECRYMRPFNSESAGSTYQYFNNKTCKPQTDQTEYSIYTRDDYKRCVCDMQCRDSNGDLKDNCEPKDDCPDA